MKSYKKPPFDGESARQAVITVGDGRGFIVQLTKRNPFQERIRLMGKVRRPPRWIKSRIVVTASHCLPHLPPAHPAAFRHERTYQALLGPLNEPTPSITTECVFVDPVSDIAVLSEPDGQVFDMAEDAFEDLVNGAEALSVGSIDDDMRGWLLSLENQWVSCTLQLGPFGGHGIRIKDAAAGIIGGMSGSPIMGDDGRAIGVVCTSGGRSGQGPYTEGGPNPSLMHSLPGWLLKQVRASK
jgi:hypothetical protein